MPILGVIASSIAKSNPGYDLIASAVGDNSSSTITFSSIPSTYTHLEIRASVRSTQNASAGGYQVRFNGISSSQYGYLGWRANAFGSSVETFLQTDNAVSSLFISGSMVGFSNTSSTATPNAASIVTIYNYKNTTGHKPVIAFGGVLGQTQAGYGGMSGPTGGNWSNTAAITSISLIISGFAFQSASEIFLYGIKEAT